MNTDLLILRLEALQLDVKKVRVAVDHANKRGEFLENARTAIRPCRSELRAVQNDLAALIQAMEDETTIVKLLDDAHPGLDRRLSDARGRVVALVARVADTEGFLKQATETAVLIADQADTLRNSLDRRCSEVEGDITSLKDRIRDEEPAQRRTQWVDYQSLLDEKARPIFVEYVDFLGGLTLRDTGLDDRVCEMTGVLLTRFKGVTPRSSLPLPARHAALGNALESVVLLGFPEWSIWGIPLVGHEVGLAYAKDQNDEDLVALVRRYVRDDQQTDPDDRRTTEYVHQLVADAFAAYTLGFAYACAALLLRLGPGYDVPHSPTEPRDIDRARVIKMAVESGAGAGGTFTDELVRLWRIWEAAVAAHAGPAEAAVALEEAEGPPPERDWLDDFCREAVDHFDTRMFIHRSDDKRWRASQHWQDFLKEGKSGPGWNSEEDAVLDLLTAAWRLRLDGSADPERFAAKIKKLWPSRGRT